jgi:outer membrane protein
MTGSFSSSCWDKRSEVLLKICVRETKGGSAVEGKMLNNKVVKSCVMLLCILGSSAVLAEGIKVATVDLRMALLSTTAAKKFGDELKKEFTADEKRLREVGDQAKLLQERLRKDGAIMSDTERSKLSAEFDEKAQEFNYLKNKYQAAIAKREEAFLVESKPKVDSALVDIAKKGGYQLVLPDNMAVFADPSLDITPQLIEALNK